MALVSLGDVLIYTFAVLCLVEVCVRVVEIFQVWQHLEHLGPVVFTVANVVVEQVEVRQTVERLLQQQQIGDVTNHFKKGLCSVVLLYSPEAPRLRDL